MGLLPLILLLSGCASMSKIAYDDKMERELRPYLADKTYALSRVELVRYVMEDLKTANERSQQDLMIRATQAVSSDPELEIRATQDDLDAIRPAFGTEVPRTRMVDFKGATTGPIEFRSLREIYVVSEAPGQPGHYAVMILNPNDGQRVFQRELELLERINPTEARLVRGFVALQH